MNLGLIGLALAPGLFWLWFFVRKNSYRPEPRRLLAMTFMLGMLAVLPAAITEMALIGDSAHASSAHLGAMAVATLLVVGPVEELSKFLVVRLYAYRSGYFEEPMDGLVYAAAASLGFASAENFFYILRYGPEVILLRGPLSTLAHLVFGGFWGYALGRSQARFGGWLIVAAGLIVAAFLHGLFDLAVLAEFPLLSIALVAVGAAWIMSRFNWARRISPFRYRRNYPFLQCPGCRQAVRVTSSACPYCGTAVRRGMAPLVCGRCNAGNRSDAVFCTQCGDRFVG